MAPTHDDGMRGDLQSILDALRQSNQASTLERQTLNQKLDEVARKQDSIPNMLSDLERRQQAALDTLRRDFERMFVSHAEYDPKHQILLDRMREYDRIILDSQARKEEFVTMRGMVKDHDDDIKGIKEHAAGAAQRILPWIAVAGSLIALFLNFAQHLHITP